MKQKIYIAGPDVFSPNAIEIGKKYIAICEKYNFIGNYPLDNEANNVTDIYNGNIKLIDNCDIVIANGNPFRGEMDIGTAFEIGYAISKNKQVYVYMNDTRDLITKNSACIDENGYSIENFGHPINLMIAESCKIIKGQFEDCIKFIKNCKK